MAQGRRRRRRRRRGEYTERREAKKVASRMRIYSVSESLKPYVKIPAGALQYTRRSLYVPESNMVGSKSPAGRPVRGSHSVPLHTFTH